MWCGSSSWWKPHQTEEDPINKDLQLQTKWFAMDSRHRPSAHRRWHCCCCNLITTDILFTPNISGILAIFECHSIFILIHSIIPLGNYIFVRFYSKSCFLELRELSRLFMIFHWHTAFICFIFARRIWFCCKFRRTVRQETFVGHGKVSECVKLNDKGYFGAGTRNKYAPINTLVQEKRWEKIEM